MRRFKTDIVIARFGQTLSDGTTSPHKPAAASKITLRPGDNGSKPPERIQRLTEPKGSRLVKYADENPAQTSNQHPQGSAEQFTQALFQLHGLIHQQTGYNALALLRMVANTGGVGAAKHLLANPRASSGFVELACQGRADLTLEYLVLNARWRALFEERERDVARIGQCPRLRRRVRRYRLVLLLGLSLSACILRPGMNADCAWPPEAPRRLDLTNGADRRHLVVDTEPLCRRSSLIGFAAAFSFIAVSRFGGKGLTKS